MPGAVQQDKVLGVVGDERPTIASGDRKQFVVWCPTQVQIPGGSGGVSGVRNKHAECVGDVVILEKFSHTTLRRVRQVCRDACVDQGFMLTIERQRSLDGFRWYGILTGDQRDVATGGVLVVHHERPDVDS